MTDVIFTKPDQPEDVAGYKKLKLEDGRTFEIEVMKTPEELYGPAYPTGLKVGPVEVAAAKLIAANLTETGGTKDRTEILISYLRGAPVIVTHPATEEMPEHSVIGVGPPSACLVAFRLGDEVRLGWSMPNSSGEPMPYSKDKARLCAVLRGMMDSVTMTGKKFATNSEGTVIPVAVCKGLRKFTDRAQRYFKQDFNNYFPNYTKK